MGFQPVQSLTPAGIVRIPGNGEASGVSLI
jgi:hypothetical protein